MNRRNLLKQTGLLGLLGLAPGIRSLATPSANHHIPSAERTGGAIIVPRKRVVRFAHLTDIHMESELHAADGVTYISNGAVSGNWWKGINHETPNGYAMLNLYDDGSFENEYVPYGWTM